MIFDAPTHRTATGWPLLFTKEEEHYITIGSKVEDAFVKLHRGPFRGAIVAPQSAAGMEVERLEH